MAALLADDDNDLDDAALWAVIDSAAAASYSLSKTTTKTTTITKPSALSPSLSPSSFTRKPLTHLTTTTTNFPSPPLSHHKTPPPPTRTSYPPSRPHKIQKSDNTNSPNTLLVKYSSPLPALHFPLSPFDNHNNNSNSNSSPIEYRGVNDDRNTNNNNNNNSNSNNNNNMFSHCLAGRFPTVSLFKDYQDAAMSILEKSDYTMISGNPFIKKSGWRKIAFYFNISFEIKDKTIEFDENRNVHRAEFIVRAFMNGGRFSDAWGSCERREKKFLKPNNDIPSTAETRAKNKACQSFVLENPTISLYPNIVGDSTNARSKCPLPFPPTFHRSEAAVTVQRTNDLQSIQELFRDLLGIGAYRPSVRHTDSPR